MKTQLAAPRVPEPQVASVRDLSRPEDPRRPDRPTTLLAVIGGAAAAFSLAAPVLDPAPDGAQLTQWLEYLAGLALLAAGVIAASRRSGVRIGRLMLVGSIVYFIPYVGILRTDLAFTISNLMFTWWLAVGAHIALAYPDGRLRSRLDRSIVLAGYVAILVITVVEMTAYDQEQLGACASDCLQNLLLVAHDPGLLDVLDQVATWMTLALGLPIVAILVARVIHATPPERRVLTPFLVALGIAVALSVASTIAYMFWPDGTAIQEAMFNIFNATLLLLPLSLLFGLLLAIVARSAAANLLYRIGQGNSAVDIERDVAWALGDPSARLAIRANPESAFLDSSGRRAQLEESPNKAVTFVGDTVAILHDPSLRRDQPELLEAVSGATRLAVDNRRLRAEVQLVRDIPGGLAERLLRGGARIGETETLTISVLMSDIRGYTTIAEHGDAHALAAQLNEHRGTMSRAISERGGTVMQFVGDAVFAVFGAPVPLQGHALQAVEAAIAMQEAQASINERWAGDGRPPFELGIGVTTGRVAAALLGSKEHVEYSVVGDVVNLAQRIQSMAGSGDVVVLDATYSELGGVMSAVQLPPAMVKGRNTPVIAHRVLGRPADLGGQVPK